MTKGHMLADVVAIIGRFYFFVYCTCYTFSAWCPLKDYTYLNKSAGYRVFHVETTWKRSFPRRFNVKYTKSAADLFKYVWSFRWHQTLTRYWNSILICVSWYRIFAWLTGRSLHFVRFCFNLFGCFDFKCSVNPCHVNVSFLYLYPWKRQWTGGIGMEHWYEMG